MRTLLCLVLFTITCFAYSWDEDPRIQEHNELTSRLMKLGDKQVAERDEDTMKILNLLVSERQKLKEKSNE